MARIVQTSGRILALLGLTVLVAAPLGSSQPGFGGRPDLVITDVQVTPETPKPGDEATITLTIANEGEGEMERTARPGVEFLVSFGPKELANLGLGLLTGVRVDKQTLRSGLESGESTDVTFNWTVLQLPKFRFIFKVDSPFDNVEESNEANNRTESTLRVNSADLTQWWLDDLNAPGAWETSRGSAETIVAVIDTGMDVNHPEFRGNLWTDPENGAHGFDFIDERIPSNRRTQIGVHGTGVAGTVAAQDDGQGTTGIAPNVRLMDLRVFESFTIGTRTVGTFAEAEDVAAAIEFAADHGADVINLSLGSVCSVEQVSRRFRDEFERGLEMERQAIQKAISQGSIVVAAAGNNGQCVEFPAKFPEAIAVGATTRGDEIAGFSSRGPEVWVSAPGGSLSPEEFFSRFEQGFGNLVPALDSLIITPYVRDNYGWFSGTSFSAPLVSGTLALMRSVDPELTVDDARGVLAATATDMGATGRDELFGHGRVDAEAAVECVANNLSCLP